MVRSDKAARILGSALLFFLVVSSAQAQPITGIWRGKMGSSKVELKLVRKDDSLIGTSYYYNSKNEYRRYSVKGYFDDKAMDVVWWDDSLLEDHWGRRFIGTGSGDALLAVADFNCPGEGVMKLDGKSSSRDNEEKGKKELHLAKGSNDPVFPDEWDFLLDNYAYCVSHPYLMDSIEQIALYPAATLPDHPLADPPVVAKNENQPSPMSSRITPREIKTDEKGIEPAGNLAAVPIPAQTNEQKFTSRTKILKTVIPLKGDSIELRFYDNAEIDGDSIAVFLNGHMLREHILLSDQAYTFKIPVADLQADNELVMVAENLGTIPPNTSLMVAIVGDKHYEAHLESDEGSSALVRLVKP